MYPIHFLTALAAILQWLTLQKVTVCSTGHTVSPISLAGPDLGISRTINKAR